MTRPLHDRGARPPGRLGLVFAVLVLPLLAWVLFNHYSDRPLPSEVQALLIAQPKPLPDADNLFLALLAFPIQGREPAHERGRAALEAYDRLPEDEAPESYAEALGRNFAVFDEAPARLCSAGNQPGAYRCMHQSREDREPLQDLVLEVAPLLQRHRELQAYPAYVDPRTPTQQVPPADVTALRINLLQLSVLTWMADAGEVERVGAELADAARTWRRVLGATDIGLVDKVVAMRALSAQLLFVSEWIAAQPAGQDLPIDALLRPFDEAELSLAGPLRREFRVQSALWTRLGDPNDPTVRAEFPEARSWWYRLMMKTNDTIERSYSDLQTLLEIEQAGCTRVSTEFEAARTHGVDTGPSWYEYFYNAVGRELQGMAGGYALQLGQLGRPCNLLALQRMVSLQRELHRRGVTRNNAAEQVRALAEQYPDPNSGDAYIYDAKDHALEFRFIGPQAEPMTRMPLAPS